MQITAKQTIKKTAALLLAIITMLGMLPAMAFAEGTALLTLDELRAEKGAITVEAYNIGRGFLIEPSLYDKTGKSTGDITVELLGRKNLSYKGSTSYFEGFSFDDTVEAAYPSYLEPYRSDLSDTGDGDGYLSEFDYSSYAGWCYTINMWWSSWGAADCYPGQMIADYNTQEEVALGDVIRWHFTAYGYGADCGFPGNAMAETFGGSLYTQADKSDLIFMLAAINDYYGNLSTDHVYETALAVAADPLAAESEVAAQETALTNYINETFLKTEAPPRDAGRHLDPERHDGTACVHRHGARFRHHRWRMDRAGSGPRRLLQQR